MSANVQSFKDRVVALFDEFANSSKQKESVEVQMSRPKSFESFFLDKSWARMNGWYSLNEEIRRKHDFYPNHVFEHRGIREVFIPMFVKPAPHLAASLGVPLLKHYSRRIDEGGVAQCWVTFGWKETNVYIGTTTIRELLREIGDEPPYVSNEGLPDYYWFGPDMKLSTKQNFFGRVSGIDHVL